MKTKEYVLVGSRYYVYKKMIDNNCDIKKIYAVKDSFLARYLEKTGVNYTILNSRDELIDDLLNLSFDYLVSNGCPYILPITKLKEAQNEKGNNSEFINIHPSLLPDCRGKSPVNAAILFDRKHGVTCHLMDDGVDTGRIIDQIEIPITDDVSLELLYRISFISEGDVFENALNKQFKPREIEVSMDGTIYYTRRYEDMIIRNDDSFENLIKKVKAFSSKGQYAKIALGDSFISIKSASEIKNNFIKNKYKNSDDGFLLAYGNSLLIKKDSKLVELVLSSEEDFELANTLLGIE